MLIRRYTRGDKKGKNLDALAVSRDYRQSFIEEFGFVPRSILVHDKTDKAIDMMAMDRDYRKMSHRELQKKDGISGKEMQKAFETAHRGVRGEGKALSRFPQNIGRLLVKFYCPERGMVYDPFAGHNSRMQLTYEANRNYIGYDVSKAFMTANLEIKDLLYQANQGKMIKLQTTITLELQDSKATGLPSDCMDFTVTSPPYWDLEYYGDEPEQLGKAKTYESFLSNLEYHVAENYRVLKPGCFCAWCVNDFRKGGVFYCYHADLIEVFRKVGFELYTVYIIDLGEPIQNAFVRNIKPRMSFSKCHEYCLVFRKGGRHVRRRRFRGEAEIDG